MTVWMLLKNYNRVFVPFKNNKCDWFWIVGGFGIDNR